MDNIVNVAIQLLPISEKDSKYEIIDRAIDLIKQSGLKYEVCPFETAIEGPYNKIMKLLEDIQQECFNGGVEEIIVNLKIHNRRNQPVRIEEKIGKYR